MSILKPLVWGANCAQSPLHAYVINHDGIKFMVTYIRMGADRSKQATGFLTVSDAKEWAWEHYNEKMQPYVVQDTIGAYFEKFTQWSLDRQIIQNGDILAQGLKLVSEIGELADNLAKDRCIKDDIGDCMVVLNNLSHMTGSPLDECLAQAWSDIKDRKGTMNSHGVFIKENDV